MKTKEAKTIKRSTKRHITKPINGWVNEGHGWYYAPHDFAQNTSYITNEFARFSRRSRARWNIFEYLRAVMTKS